MNTICPSGRITMPCIRFRVVCGFDVTIATFCPTNRFNSVDFPVFGRPMIATNPARLFCFFSVCRFLATVPLASQPDAPARAHAEMTVHKSASGVGAFISDIGRSEKLGFSP
jgi:hypothetical protein